MGNLLGAYASRQPAPPTPGVDTPSTTGSTVQ